MVNSNKIKMTGGVRLITVLGPTATGKTRFAVRLAKELGGEVVSADSRQVYRGMDIGTGKDMDEYSLDGQNIKCHLVDIVEPGYHYNVFEYQRDFLEVWNDMLQRGKQPVLCGGSGMYLESVLKGYKLINVPLDDRLREELAGKSDSELVNLLKSFRPLHNTTDIISRKRLVRAIEIEKYQSHNKGKKFSYPEFSNVIFGIHAARELVRERITERLSFRLENGLIEEVRSLLSSGLTSEQLEFYGLEYKFVTWYITGKMGYEEMKRSLNTAIHQFSKRQMTWFRRMERNGYKIHWLDAELEMNEKLSNALSIINSF